MESSSKSKLRSITLPLTPSSTQIKIYINKLKTLVSFSPSRTIQSGLVCLIDMYLLIDELIGSSQTQQVDLRNGNRVLVEDALVGSVGLLDSCSNLIILLTLMKENVRTLQSVLRRKGIAIDASGETHISDYFSCQNKAKKDIAKNLGSLKKMERKTESYILSGQDQHLSIVTGVLREVITSTISVFQALLLCFSIKRKPADGLLLIAKLMPTSKLSCYRNHDAIDDVDMVDVALRTLHKKVGNNENKKVDVQMATERLLNLDRQIEGFETVLDCLFRRLIRIRVSLLNTLAN